MLAQFLPLAKWVESFSAWIRNQGAAGYVLFSIAYIAATILFFPAALLTMAAGIAFGPARGAIVALPSATISAAISFLIARYLARDRVEQKAARSEQFRALDQAVGKDGWKIVLLLRLSPLIPFNLSNYLYGLTRIRFGQYVLASFIGMVPGTFLYASLGHAGRISLARDHTKSLPENIFLGVGLVATIAVTIYLSSLARQALRKHNSVKTPAE